LDKEDITSCFLDSFTQVEEVLTFFLQDLVHLSVVVDHNLVVHLLFSNVLQQPTNRPTSGLGEESWNWIRPILAFSILVGPPALFMTGWFNANPSINSVSSIVPPTFLTSRISLKSTLDEVGVTSRVTAETAIGARVEEYCETIYSSACLWTPEP
jgi:hypothetical protein